jgi:hypothetical protein
MALIGPVFISSPRLGSLPEKKNFIVVANSSAQGKILPFKGK